LYKHIAWEAVLELARRFNRRKIVVLMYHEVLSDDEPIDAWTVVKETDFALQMDYLRSHFSVVSLDEAYKKMSHKSIQNNKNLAVVTFDDGYAGNGKVVLPIIESIGIPITIFVSTGAVLNQRINWYDRIITAFQSDKEIIVDLKVYGLDIYIICPQFPGERKWTEIERLLSALKSLTPNKREESVEYILEKFGSLQAMSLASLTVSEIKQMSKSPFVTIGAHSHCHSILTQLETKRVRESIKQSKTLLEEWTGLPVNHFAYPNGNYNTDIIEVLRETGFATAMSTSTQLWDASVSPYAIPRIGIGRFDSFERFKARISGIII